MFCLPQYCQGWRWLGSKSPTVSLLFCFHLQHSTYMALFCPPKAPQRPAFDMFQKIVVSKNLIKIKIFLECFFFNYYFALWHHESALFWQELTVNAYLCIALSADSSYVKAFEDTIRVHLYPIESKHAGTFCCFPDLFIYLFKEYVQTPHFKIVYFLLFEGPDTISFCISHAPSSHLSTLDM